MIQVIDLLNYLYCPRYIYFQYKLEIPQYEEKYFKVLKGREIHEKKRIRNKEYLRKKLGVTQKYINLYMSNGKIRGVPDEIIQMHHKEYAVLEYKFSPYQDKIYTPVKYQLIAYSLLVEHTFNTKVNKAFLVFVRSKNKLVSVSVTENDKKSIQAAIDEIYEILEKDFFPKPTTTKKKCVSCTYKNICVL